MFYQDTMDPSRVVKPLRTEGRQTICAIYWKDHGQLRFGGEAPVPTSLLSDEPINKRIGFVPANRD